MINNKLFTEILQEFEDAKTEQDKISVLQKYKSDRLEEFFYYAFSPNIKFIIPPLRYRPAQEPAGLNYTYLTSEVQKLYRFIENHPRNNPPLSNEKIKSLLTVTLESLHKDEAALLVTVMQKELNVDGLTIDLLKKVYPGINL